MRFLVYVTGTFVKEFDSASPEEAEALANADILEGDMANWDMTADVEVSEVVAR